LVQNKDAAQLTYTAYILKSSSAVLGSVHLADLCQKLKTIGHSEAGARIAEAEELLIAFEAQYRHVILASQIKPTN
jgi:HPt (histidine-containing phosphotransfer) domain-containing protein